MSGLEVDGFHDLAVEIERLANNFDEMSERHDRETAREAIEEGVSDAFEKIAKDARRRAKSYVPEEHAETIEEESVGWVGDKYKHDLSSPSVIVASHEFGSGLHSINGRGTVDVPGSGYFIPKPLSKGPIRLRDHPADTEQNPIIVEYVVHPGVKPKRFMHRALVENEQVIQGHVGGHMSRIMRERGIIS